MAKFRYLLCIRLCSILFLLAVTACSPSNSRTIFPVSESTVPTSLFVTVPAVKTAAPVGPSPTTSQDDPVFKVAVIVDVTSKAVTRKQAGSLINQVEGLLSPFSPIGLRMMDFVEDSNGGTTEEIANRYIASYPAALPNGIVILSAGDGGRAALEGGYGGSLPAPSEFRNAFRSPVVGAGQIYVVVVDPNYKYAACGYGGSDTLQSPVSIGSECRNHPGTSCVQRNGYSMCADVAGDLYSSTPMTFVASTIVHELLGSFSPGGDKDHYATPECNARMGYPEGFYDKQEGQYYNGLCPFVYEDFTNSYQP